MVIGRRGELPFFASELTRLAHLVGGVDATESPEPAVATRLTDAHRTPVSAPLYSREDQPPPPTP